MRAKCFLMAVVALLTIGIATIVFAQDTPAPPPGKVAVPIWGTEYLGAIHRPESSWTNFEILVWNDTTKRYDRVVLRRNVRPAITHQYRRIIIGWKLIDWN